MDPVIDALRARHPAWIISRDGDRLTAVRGGYHASACSAPALDKLIDDYDAGNGA